MDALLPASDLAVRAGLITLMLFVAALVWRDHARSPVARLAAALALGVAMYAVQSAAGFAAWPVWARAPVSALSAGNAVVFWLFSRALFDDEFRWRPWHAAAWGVLALAALVGCLGPVSAAAAAPPLGLAIRLATLGFAVLAVAQSLSSWRTDLVERRRRLRIFIVGAGALYPVLGLGARLLLGEAGEVTGLVDVLGLSAIAALVAWQLVRAPGAQLFALEAARPAPAVVPPESSSSSDAPDTALIASLEEWMATERAYRQDGLTIGALARQLKVPEYKLRRAINQGLGYRNFNAFLNRYRIAEVKAALADPAQAPVPVLTLAMDAGFQSLGPFNRAFKAETGVTPTEFRRASAA